MITDKAHQLMYKIRWAYRNLNLGLIKKLVDTIESDIDLVPEDKPELLEVANKAIEDLEDHFAWVDSQS